MSYTSKLLSKDTEKDDFIIRVEKEIIQGVKIRIVKADDTIEEIIVHSGDIVKVKFIKLGREINIASLAPIDLVKSYETSNDYNRTIARSQSSLVECIGKITNITEESLTIDCSEKYNTKVVKVFISSIRSIKKVIEEEENPKDDNADSSEKDDNNTEDSSEKDDNNTEDSLGKEENDNPQQL